MYSVSNNIYKDSLSPLKMRNIFFPQNLLNNIYPFRMDPTDILTD